MRFLNTDESIGSERHYQIPPFPRIDLDEVRPLVGMPKYFVVYAPRQTGKTEVLGAHLDDLPATGQYRRVHGNVEVEQSAREEVDAAMRSVRSALAKESAWTTGDSLVEQSWSEILDRSRPHYAFIRIPS